MIIKEFGKVVADCGHLGIDNNCLTCSLTDEYCVLIERYEDSRLEPTGICPEEERNRREGVNLEYEANRAYLLSR
jgi:hypothetical protein